MKTEIVKEQTKVRETGRKGFTLLEIMIALAIIGITVTVALQTVNYQAGVMYENSLSTIMYQAAKEKMYELENEHKNSKGGIQETGLTYENIVSVSKDSHIVKLKTVVRGHGREVTLNEFVPEKPGN